MRPHGRATISRTNPRALGICQRCGFMHNHDQLRWQYEYGGMRLINLRILVCETCYDTPQIQLRTILIPPDPTPIEFPVPEQYAGTDNPLSAIGFSPIALGYAVQPTAAPTNLYTPASFSPTGLTNSGSASVTVTQVAAPAGVTVVIAIFPNGSGASAVVDSAGNTYTLAISSLTSGDVAIYYSKNIANAMPVGTSFTVTTVGGVQWAMVGGAFLPNGTILGRTSLASSAGSVGTTNVIPPSDHSNVIFSSISLASVPTTFIQANTGSWTSLMPTTYAVTNGLDFSYTLKASNYNPTWSPTAGYDAVLAAFIVPNVVLPQVFGMNFGTLNQFGGVNSAFDGNLAKHSWMSAVSTLSVNGYNNFIGKNWNGASNPTNPGTTPSVVQAAVTYTVNAFVVSAPLDMAISGGGATGIELQGSPDGANWTTLYSGTTAGTINEQFSVSTGITTTTAYQYHQVVIQGDDVHQISVAQVQFSVVSTGQNEQ